MDGQEQAKLLGTTSDARKTAAEGEAEVALRAVSKSFGRDGRNVEVLHGVSATVHKGAVVTLVGPSGSGKSTLLAVCNLMSTPDGGEVFIAGREVRQWNVRELRRYVGLAFQSATMFPGTVQDNLELGPKLRGHSLADPRAYLRRLGLGVDLLTANADDLSGGQKQRVALGRVLANEPKVLLLDEVTSALDPAAAKEIEEWIVQLQREQGLTLLWVTHNLEQARRVGTETWLMVNGRLVEASATEDFFEHPQHELTRRFLDGELGGAEQ
ncbi:ABC transporter ATP-binding protein [Alicyclobacillus sp. ALC3]|uniref:ABC transporter ATP-binding protein n=1 Tax=Alicyclobacillus sp. ALC3 TaxID=2796143 RepID=UPI002378ACB0|nr:phosphate ABC transporter ATP-binding protein [Alicyclobacillus sp. ALC3]WDL96277.1 ATP-binding cassette domain-containing protein [Alicyclobacillus sp. ALC3]